jgi:hypothetical protein
LTGLPPPAAGGSLTEEEIKDVVNSTKSEISVSLTRMAKVVYIKVEPLIWPSVTIAIISRAFLRVRENLIGFCYTSELFLGLLPCSGVLVWVEFLCLFAIRSLDLCLASITVYP